MQVFTCDLHTLMIVMFAKPLVTSHVTRLAQSHDQWLHFSPGVAVKQQLIV